MANYQAPRGTYDCSYEDAFRMEEIVDLLKSLARVYGYAPIYTPTFESTALFARSAGEDSDIVTKEMYNFTDKSGRDMCLRPEFTAGVMRAIVTEKLYATRDLPLKLYYFGSAFRYERPQAGRYREFRQFGIENVGVSSPYSDAETVLFGYHALELLGFSNVVLKINSIGDKESRDLYRSALREFFTDKIDGMCEDCRRRLELNPLRILDCKVKEDRAIISGAPKMGDYLNEKSKKYFQSVLSILDEEGIDYQVDPSLVRGLDYYSHTVFEFHCIGDSGANLGAICGGGHYDHLLEDVGGPELSSVGLAFGIERLNLLKENDDRLSELDVYAISMNEENTGEVFSLVQNLRLNGFRAEMTFGKKSLSSALKVALRKKARFALIVGEEEIQKDTVQVKNLSTHAQEEVNIGEIVDYLDREIGKEQEE